MSKVISSLVVGDSYPMFVKAGDASSVVWERVGDLVRTANGLVPSFVGAGARFAPAWDARADRPFEPVATVRFGVGPVSRGIREVAVVNCNSRVMAEMRSVARRVVPSSDLRRSR